MLALLQPPLTSAPSWRLCYSLAYAGCYTENSKGFSDPYYKSSRKLVVTPMLPMILTL